ncbi:MAG: peptidoglycan DD-metalloendopeptidase family protein [Actinomycetota bacterium]|nr:peptidoglycan DD-metalloendopeptidase family protein [Actinomycetota bacterium]
MRPVVTGPVIALSLAMGTVLGVAGPAAAVPAPDFEAPFPCGQNWVGATFSGHSPSVYSVDFNRPDDIGDLTVSTAPGVVTRVTDTGSTSYGKYIVVDHGDGYSSLYAHLLAQYVTTGQRVDQGTILGLVGTSGGSSGPHLHFEQKLGSQVQKPYFHQTAYAFGSTLTSRSCPDVPIAGNWDGRGSDEVAVFRRGVGTGIFRLYREGSKPQRVELGYSSDSPLTGDWDGNGTTDVGVRTSGSKEFVLRRADGTTTSLEYGWRSDVPVTGDWDGDGDTEIGVWRPSAQRFRMRVAPGDIRVTRLGSVGALPVTGDWNGDGRTDIGVFEPSLGKYTLRTRPIGPAATTVVFGTRTDLPVTGDWNGDGRTDLGTWAPATGTFSKRASTGAVSTQRFGLARIR